MSTQRNSLAEQFIQNRRRVEANENNLNSYLKFDKVARHVADWEVKGEDLQKTKFVRSRMTQLRHESNKQIVDRQCALKDLYDLEHEKYTVELRELRPTKEQIKEGMVERVEDLKKRREAQRQQEVAEKLDRRFRADADELRRVEANIKENLTKVDREKQVMEKHEIMERNFEEEMFYAELWRREKINKDRSEAEIAKEKQAKNVARNDILADQYQQLQDAKSQSKSESQMEKGMLREQWDLEAQKSRDDAGEQARIKEKMHGEIKTQNMMYRQMKMDKEQQDQDMDRDRVRQIVSKEQILDQLDQEKKDKYKADTRAFLLNFKNRANEAQLNQDHLDVLLKEENDKQQRKMQEKWDREENARVDLMRDVYKNREEALYYKKDILDNAQREKEMEKSEVRQQIGEFTEAEKRKELEEIMRNKQHQNELLWQVNERNENKRATLLKEMESERERRLVELNYERRIKEEEQRGKQIVADAKYSRYY